MCETRIRQILMVDHSFKRFASDDYKVWIETKKLYIQKKFCWRKLQKFSSSSLNIGWDLNLKSQKCNHNRIKAHLGKLANLKNQIKTNQSQKYNKAKQNLLWRL